MKPGELLRGEGRCLGPEQLEAYIEGRLPEAGAHVESCAACAHEAASLREFLEASPSAAEAADLEWVQSRMRPPMRKERHSPFAWLAPEGARRWALTLAALLLVVAGGIQLRRLAGPGLPAEPSDLVRAASVRLVSPSGDLAEAPAEFQWERVEKADSYRVELSEVDGTILWTGRSNSEKLSAPPGIQHFAIARKTLVWRVTALGADGSTIAESAPGKFRVMLPEQR